MLKSKYLNSNRIIFGLAISVLFSCSSAPEKIELSGDDNSQKSHALSVTDSLLNIVDEEFEHIKHDAERNENMYNQLLEKVRISQSIINSKDEQIYGLVEYIDTLKYEIARRDSSIDKLESELIKRETSLNKLRESNKSGRVRMREERAMYDATIFKLEDSLSILNDSIYRMELFIKQNVRPAKLRGTLIEE
jgi:chromosome segregation ATPase